MPTLGPASSAEPQSREVVRLIAAVDSQPPPRSTCATPACGLGPGSSAYQSDVHSSTLPLRSCTPNTLAPAGCVPTRAGRGAQPLPDCTLRRTFALVHAGAAPQG